MKLCDDQGHQWPDIGGSALAGCEVTLPLASVTTDRQVLRVLNLREFSSIGLRSHGTGTIVLRFQNESSMVSKEVARGWPELWFDLSTGLTASSNRPLPRILRSLNYRRRSLRTCFEGHLVEQSAIYGSYNFPVASDQCRTGPLSCSEGVHMAWSG